MRRRQSEEFETYHLTCPVCGALPGTSCIDEEFQELARVHPSRRMSVAERNWRRHESGWEPPELVERRIKERRTRIARAPVFSPRPGPGVNAALDNRRHRVGVEPTRGLRSTSSLPLKAAPAIRKEASAEAPGPQAERDAWGRLHAYLGRHPRGAAVPRQVLREIASEASPAAGPVPISLGKRSRLRAEGLVSPSSKGSRSTLRLSAHLKRLEVLGLVRRDSNRDAIIVIDPGGLRMLVATPHQQ